MVKEKRPSQYDVYTFQTGANYRKHCMKIARQLGYDKETVKRIKNAKTDNEVARILHQARLNDHDFDQKAIGGTKNVKNRKKRNDVTGTIRNSD